MFDIIFMLFTLLLSKCDEILFQLFMNTFSRSFGSLITSLSKKGSKKGSKFGEFVSSRDLHIEAQALTNMVEDFPSRTAWCVLIPMEKPLLGKRVI
jgi:hypothetical protein